MRKKMLLRVARCALLVFTHGAVVFSASLRTPFIETYMPDVVMGKKTVITSNSGEGVFLNNPGTKPVLVRLDFRAPLPDELKEKAEAIPDLSWIQADSLEVTIAPQSSVRVPLWIHVPKNSRFHRRTFQVMMISRMIPRKKGAMTIQAGLKSTIRFTLR